MIADAQIRLSGRSSYLLRSFAQLTQRYVQRFGDTFSYVNANRYLGSLDRTGVGAVNASRRRHRFLGQPYLFSPLPDRGGNSLFNGFHGKNYGEVLPAMRQIIE